MIFVDKIKDFIRGNDVNFEGMKEVFEKSFFNSPNYEIFSNRNTLLRDIPLMLKDPIISSCLQIIMESAFPVNDGSSIIRITSPYDQVKRELEEFHKEYNLEDVLLVIAFNLMLYGNLPIKMNFDSTYTKFKGFNYIPDFRSVTPLIFNGKQVGHKYKDKFWDSFEFVYAQYLYYKDLGVNQFLFNFQFNEKEIANEFVYAPSYLSSAVRPWRSVTVIEQALVLQRMDVSNFMRIIGVNIGDNVFSKNAIKLMNFYRQIFKKVRRVSFDGDGMSNGSIGNEFEVVVPLGTNQGLEIKEIGGQVDVKALKDLEFQYKKLFAALKVQQSYIGFAEDTGGGMAESPANRRDERFARTVKALRWSATKAVKRIDEIYLRSKGYNVTSDDFNFVFVTPSSIEEEQKRLSQKSMMETIGFVVTTMDSINFPYDKDYLLKTLFSELLMSSHLDFDILFKKGKKVPENQIKSSVNLLKEDRLKDMEVFKDVGMITEEEYDDASKEQKFISSKLINNKIPYDVYLAGADVFQDTDFEVDIAEKVISKRINKQYYEKIIIKQKDVDPDSKSKIPVEGVKLPFKSVVFSSCHVLKVNELAQGRDFIINNLYILPDSSYYLDKPDLINYLSLLESGQSMFYVKNVYKNRHKRRI
jgi:hypothetical protein